MNKPRDIERAIKDLRFTTSDEADARIRQHLSGARLQRDRRHLELNQSAIWSIIMTSTWSKVGTLAAALAVIAAVLTLAVNLSGEPAYAIEQTLAANDAVRNFHIRLSPIETGVAEAWAQLDDLGELLHLRMDSPETGDGPKVVVWEAGKATVLMERQQVLGIIHAKEMVDGYAKMLTTWDPVTAMAQLHDAQAKGTAQVETHEPRTAGDHIRLVATYSDKPGIRAEYLVNARTKLLEEIQKFRISGDEATLVTRLRYADYNQPIDPDVFVLTAPPGFVTINETTQVIGLVKGDLTDEQITVKVVREFFEALIARDYGKAGQLLSGLPAAKVEEVFGKTNIVRIVSIGQPQLNPPMGGRGYVVSCKFEVERDGVKHIEEKPTVRVRAVHSQPDRWTIYGGL